LDLTDFLKILANPSETWGHRGPSTGAGDRRQFVHFNGTGGSRVDPEITKVAELTSGVVEVGRFVHGKRATGIAAV
jgi:hypothetical protein